jgi:hypothetical protein
VVSAALAIGALAAACSSTGYSYVKNSDDRTYFKVPDQWTIFDEDALAAGSDLSPREQEELRESGWTVGFDASPRPSLDHINNPRARYPTGVASVNELDFDTSDNVSMAALRNWFVDVDGAVQAGQGEMIEYEPLEPEGGFRGFHMVAEVALEDRVITFDQTTLVDQATSKLYHLLVTCEARCYSDNADKIDRVVGSWTVEE